MTFNSELDDARYAVRAWAQGVSWSVVVAGLGSILTGLAQHDTALLASGVTAVVVAFIPRARPQWIYEVARTWAMKQGWTAVPAEERPLRSPAELLDERIKTHGWVTVEEGWRDDDPPTVVRPIAEVRRGDEQ